MNAALQRLTRGPARRPAGVVASVLAVAAVTGAIYALRPIAPVLSGDKR